MYSNFKRPYFATTCYDLDEAEHLLIVGEFMDNGKTDDSSVDCLKFGLKEGRDMIYHLIAGKEYDSPIHGPVAVVEGEDDCPIARNVIESMGAVKLYMMLEEDIGDEFSKSLLHADATIDITEVMRLSKIQNGLVKKYPAVKLLRVLKKQSMEKLKGRTAASSQMNASSGSSGGYTSPNQGGNEHGKENEHET